MNFAIYILICKRRLLYIFNSVEALSITADT
uniref:Uncharacterized protein n=1 Tax=Lepeophtheirus salmonis TaxID=72036 RepID=A0A0K2U7Q4_LEPSM